MALRLAPKRSWCKCGAVSSNGHIIWTLEQFPHTL